MLLFDLSVCEQQVKRSSFFKMYLKCMITFQTLTPAGSSRNHSEEV